MKKIVSKNYNELVIFDDVTNTVEEQYTVGYGFRLYKMKDDGEIITKEEIIPYTKDCYLLWMECRNYSKWVVIDDKATIFDIDNAVSSLNEKPSVKNSEYEKCDTYACTSF